jgi:ABC-type methionine transport system ATPase subunit
MKARFHLTFPEHLISEPVIHRVGKDFDLVTNIRRANIEERNAWVILEMEGADDDIARAVAWLAQQGSRVNRIDETPWGSSRKLGEASS